MFIEDLLGFFFFVKVEFNHLQFLCFSILCVVPEGKKEKVNETIDWFPGKLNGLCFR